MHLGSWAPAPLATPARRPLTASVEAIVGAVEKSSPAQGDALRAAAIADDEAWSTTYGAAVDVSQVGLERNVFRYRPLPVTVRLAEGGDPAELARVLVAGTRAGARLTVSSAIALPPALAAALGPEAVTTVDDAGFDALLSRGELATSRIRLIGPPSAQGRLAIALKGDPSVAVFAARVTPSPRLELLPFLREQAVAITAHRFGNPDPWSESVL